MRNEIVEQVYEDYFEHQEKLQDNDYLSIYCLVEKFENNDDYLYLQNTKICPMDDLLCCSIEADSIKYRLRDNRYLYIVIHWVSGSDAYISQIYIENENDEDDSEILYDK